MSLELIEETIKRVEPENAAILKKYKDKWIFMDTEAKEALMTLCFIMLDELKLGDEEE
jgi:hypothetical protein